MGGAVAGAPSEGNNAGMRTAEWNDAVSVIDRVTAVLAAFKAEDRRLGVSELARRANLPKSTVSRLVSELVEHRYLERDGTGVRLGVRLFELGELAAQPKELRSLALATMADLRDTTGQTVQLGVLEGTDVVHIASLRGRGPATQAFRVGGRVPAHSSAMGRAILAFSPPEVLERVVPTTDLAAFRKELEKIRTARVAYDRDESGAGNTCAASPILTTTHEPVAAISVSGRVGLFDIRRAGPAVHTAALVLGRLLPVCPPDGSY